MQVFERKMIAGWGDMDFNSHMRNTAYLDKAVDLRMLFLAAHGCPMEEFARLRVGPVVLRDEVEYYREVNLLEELTVSLECAAMAADGTRWAMRNTFVRADGKRAAQVTSTGGWLDLAARKLIAPPPVLLAALQDMPRSADFQQLS